MDEEPSTSHHNPLHHQILRPLRQGELFSSYEEFKLRLGEHKEATSTDYWVRDCRTLAKAAGNIPRSLRAHADLKYYYIKLNCKYGGQNFKSKSQNKRKFTGYVRGGYNTPSSIKYLKSRQPAHHFLLLKLA
jgi:hypothetical protein